MPKYDGDKEKVEAPEAPYMTVLTKNVIGVIRVIVISFQLWALIFLRDHM